MRALVAQSGGKLHSRNRMAGQGGIAYSWVVVSCWRYCRPRSWSATGALSGDVNLAFTGPRNGTVNIDKFDISPDGTRMVAIGNWTYVAGLQRDQIVMLNLATSPVSVTAWTTTRYQQQCAKVFDT